MEKSIAKKDTKEKGQRLVEDKPKSTKAPKFSKRYYHSKVVDSTI